MEKVKSTFLCKRLVQGRTGKLQLRHERHWTSTRDGNLGHLPTHAHVRIPLMSLVPCANAAQPSELSQSYVCELGASGTVKASG